MPLFLPTNLGRDGGFTAVDCPRRADVRQCVRELQNLNAGRLVDPAFHMA
jgi:hypothetical protein